MFQIVQFNLVLDLFQRMHLFSIDFWLVLNYMIHTDDIFFFHFYTRYLSNKITVYF